MADKPKEGRMAVRLGKREEFWDYEVIAPGGEQVIHGGGFDAPDKALIEGAGFAVDHLIWNYNGLGTITLKGVGISGKPGN